MTLQRDVAIGKLFKDSSIEDKFKISDDYHGNLVAQQAVHRKCYNIHRNWRHNMKLHYKHLKNVLNVDPYSHPYEHVTQEDWCHLVDDVWKSKEHKVRSKAGKKNRKKLEYNHCSGSRSFVATMTIPPEFNGCENLEFPEFYKKTHTKKNKEWIDPICAVKHVVKDVELARRIFPIRCVINIRGDV
ncbi:uncharacterized protein LOC103718272 isoform X1 [Phoenix dactylifera]|uniref:Uncharacterized protein LOC103718272 isoform X1 n=1 Tax=Phoenix dactylifera TaxID=42345 RepID=A0A8B8ZHM2_PHODC|nr:uncharacterized protein LOC103718272 isoform X1 [Phoenix dactylifera]XP_038970949.1 uncharacterized protein LOC103718272 isoform X1 [Phoenix dactylifera]